MQDLWNTLAYLNSKGITGDQIMVNFMGWTAPWMGGSGAYGSASYITNNAQTNQDIATMIASLVYYGHHRRDISGANQNLNFNYIAPFNEIDLNGLEGPLISPSQLNTIYGNIVTTLNTIGDTNTKIIGPDTASGPDSYTSTFSTAVKARMSHFSWHSYSGSPASPATAHEGIKADWMTETSKWCSGCDNNQPPSESEWSFGKGTGDILLGDIKNGFSSVLTWEGFDTYYYHHNSFSAWGHVGCSQNGGGCVISDTYPRVYSIRGRAWPEATIAKAIRPGMVRLGVTTALSTLSVLSFYDATTGKFSIVGHNTGGSAITINGQLQNLPNISSLSLYQTNSSLNLQHMNDVVLNGELFTATIPADTFFYFINIAPVLTTITVSPATANLLVGGTQTFTAASKDQNGNPIAATITWTSSNTAVGTIDESGKLTALAEGTTTITAASGSVSGTATVTVTAIPPTEKFSVTFIVTDSKTRKPIHDAEVSMDSVTIVTNDLGIAVFADVAFGDHEYNVDGDKYLETTGSVSVEGDTTENVSLDRQHGPVQTLLS
jgi:hypothetical protein